MAEAIQNDEDGLMPLPVSNEPNGVKIEPKYEDGNDNNNDYMNNGIKTENNDNNNNNNGYPCTTDANNNNNNNNNNVSFVYNDWIYDTDFDYHDFGDRNYDYLNSDEEIGESHSNIPYQNNSYDDPYDYHVPLQYDGTQAQMQMQMQYQTPNQGNNSNIPQRRPFGAIYEGQRQNSNELVCSWPNCNQSYFTTRDLKRHERTHERAAKARMQSNNQNNGTYNTPNSNLNTNRNGNDSRSYNHSNNKNSEFACEVCHKTFASRSSMKNHFKSQHTTERPFKCSMCDKAYVARSYLKKHFKMQHETECPFICNYDNCNKRFKVNYLLQAHIKNVHLQIKRFRCHSCQKGFAKRYNLKQHCLKQHGIDIDTTQGYPAE